MKIINKILKKSDFPLEYLEEPKFEYTNGDLLISNYKRIISLDEKCIDTVYFNIKGKNLKISSMDGYSLNIVGCICELVIKNV